MRCRCRPGDKDPCASCQRMIDVEEELRDHPESHRDYDAIVAGEERGYERWLDRIAP